MQKTAKSTFRPRAKCRKQQNLRFAHGRNAENGKINVSATAEMRKTVKNTFPPRRKYKKWQNLRFCHGGNTKNGKIYVSATAEMQKTAKLTFLPRQKHFSNQFLFFIMMIKDLKKSRLQNMEHFQFAGHQYFQM